MKFKINICQFLREKNNIQNVCQFLKIKSKTYACKFLKIKLKKNMFVYFQK